MIHYFATAHHAFPMNSFLEHWGRELRGEVTTYPYAYLLDASRELAPGTVVFSDVERLSAEDAERLAAYRDRLTDSGRPYRVLNHPTRSMRRRELLDALRAEGGNEFGVRRLVESLEGVRWPVFLRGEDDHEGNLTPLLHTPAELDAAIAGLDDAAGKLCVEFVESRGSDGLYRKYSAFRVGEAIVARHVFFSRDWMQKEADLDEPALLAEELAYVRTNPHAEALMDVFRTARIEYGRIDYAWLDGAPQVWEINTNPMVASPEGAKYASRAEVHETAASAYIDALRATVPEGAGGLWNRLRGRLGR